MKCPVCNRDNGADVSFCEGCGRKIPRCPTCGVELTCRDRFCSNDGTRLSDDLLILVPEETVLQEPVWSQPAAPAGAAEPVLPDPWAEADYEETVRVTPVSGGRQWQSGPVVRNSDPVAMPDWDQLDAPVQPPQRAFCENCGKRVAPGNRYCSECQRAIHKKESSGKLGKTGKVILSLILIILLLLGLGAGGYALVNSDLFDWDSSSSNRAEKNDEEEDEGDEESVSESEDIPAGDTTEDVPTPGVEDPVDTTPVAAETTPTESSEAPTETTAPVVEEMTPLMYWIENCDKKYLTAEDLVGFDAQMCVYARNACYAKSGRMFNSTELQNYFAQFDWYHPTVSPNNFTNSMLNSYQVANINLILEYERAHGYN